ncbi:MAG: AI-2E family transporter [Acidobacteria bacterium]|nr:AI-2E family transporter [Acidobacteriota bacterium]
MSRTKETEAPKIKTSAREAAAARTYDPQTFPKERVLTIALLVATVAALGLCYWILQPFLPAVAWALTLAIIGHPIHLWFERRIANRDFAAGLAVAVVTIALVLPAVFVGHELVTQAVEGYGKVQAQLESGEWQRSASQAPVIGRAVEFVASRVDLRDSAQTLAQGVSSRLGTWVKSWIWGIVLLLVTIFTLFFFFRDRARTLRVLKSVVPLSPREADQVFKRVEDTIKATVYGTIGVAALQGSLVAMMFWILGLPAPVVWGVVMTVLATVPNLGTFIVWAPAALVLGLHGSWTKALILTGWGLGPVALIDNLVYPYIVGQRMRMHTLAVFFSVLGGLMAFGASGLILGPVVFALTVALVDIWRRRTAG